MFTSLGKVVRLERAHISALIQMFIYWPNVNVILINNSEQQFLVITASFSFDEIGDRLTAVVYFFVNSNYFPQVNLKYKIFK